MLDDTNRMIVTDDNGQEIEMEIVLTFPDPETGKNFVLFKDPNDADENVYAYTYDDENLEAVSDPDDLEKCEEVLDAYLAQVNGDGEEEA